MSKSDSKSIGNFSTEMLQQLSIRPESLLGSCIPEACHDFSLIESRLFLERITWCSYQITPIQSGFNTYTHTHTAHTLSERLLLARDIEQLLEIEMTGKHSKYLPFISPSRCRAACALPQPFQQLKEAHHQSAVAYSTMPISFSIECRQMLCEITVSANLVQSHNDILQASSGTISMHNCICPHDLCHSGAAGNGMILPFDGFPRDILSGRRGSWWALRCGGH